MEINKFMVAHNFAEELIKRCRSKFSVNVDLMEDVAKDLLKEVNERVKHDCDTCKWYCYDDESMSCRTCPHNSKVKGCACFEYGAEDGVIICQDYEKYECRIPCKEDDDERA